MIKKSSDKKKGAYIAGFKAGALKGSSPISKKEAKSMGARGKAMLKGQSAGKKELAMAERLKEQNFRKKMGLSNATKSVRSKKK
jgi:hypothetical protein